MPKPTIHKYTDLHMSAHAQQQAHVHAHRPHVCACLAADPEHRQVPVLIVLNQLAVVDGADAQLALHGGNEGRALEQGTCEHL